MPRLEKGMIGPASLLHSRHWVLFFLSFNEHLALKVTNSSNSSWPDLWWKRQHFDKTHNDQFIIIDHFSQAIIISILDLDLLVFVEVLHNWNQLIGVHEEAHHVQDSAFSDQESKKYPLHFPHIKGRVAPPYQLSQGWWLLFSRRQRHQRRSYCQSGWEEFKDPPEDAKLLLVKPGLEDVNDNHAPMSRSCPWPPARPAWLGAHLAMLCFAKHCKTRGKHKSYFAAIEWPWKCR